MAPKKKPSTEPDVPFLQRKVNIPKIGEVSLQTILVVCVIFSTPFGQGLLDRIGVMTQLQDLATIKRDVAEIKNQVVSLKVEVAEIKSLADVKKQALESVAAK